MNHISANSSTVSDNNGIYHISHNAEKKIAAAKLEAMTEDAIYPFKIDDPTSIAKHGSFKEQYEKLRGNKKVIPCYVHVVMERNVNGHELNDQYYSIKYKPRQVMIDNALAFYESSHLEEFLSILDREGQANDYFDFVQEAVTLRKLLIAEYVEAYLKADGQKYPNDTRVQSCLDWLAKYRSVENA